MDDSSASLPGRMSIVGQAFSPVRASEQARSARMVALLRVLVSGIALVLFLVLGRGFGLALWQRGDLALLPYFPIAVALLVVVRRSERAARISAYMIAALDAPVIGLVQWLVMPSVADQGEFVAMSVAAMVLLVAGSSLWMEWRIIALTAASATVVQSVVEITAVGNVFSVLQIVMIMSVGAGLMAYLSWRQSSSVRAASDLLLAQRLAEFSARTAQVSVQNLIEQSPDAAIVHRNGRVLTVNAAFYSMTGWKGDPATGVCEPLDWVHTEDHATVAASFREADRTGLPTTAEDVRLAGAHGTWIPAEARSVRVLFEGEAAIATVFRDISERKKMQEHLVITERMASMGTLAAGVGHEINNPLSAVMGNLEYVEAVLEDPSSTALAPDKLAAELAEPIKDARDAAERIKVIVRDLRMFVRDADEGSHPLDIHEVLESSIRVAWNEIKHKAKVVREYGTVPMVEANRARLGQVFLNLLVNAAQAMPDRQATQNEIRIVSRATSDGGATVEIHDTGCGMSPEVARRVFDPFFTTKPVGQGTGLGLAIAHRLIEEVGGRIELQSEPGRGSTFRVTFPSLLDSSKNRDDAPVESGVLESRRRLLVVDDEQAVLNVIERLVRAEHHDVVSCRRAADALERIRSGERFDAILCDVMMPEMTGIELHDALSRDVPDQAQRMVFVTGGAFTQAARTFLASVPNPCVHKPVDAESLRVAVQKVVA